MLSYLASKQEGKYQFDPATGGHTGRRKKELLAQDLGDRGAREYSAISTQGAGEDELAQIPLPRQFLHGAGQGVAR